MPTSASYQFKLTFTLPAGAPNPEQHLDALFEAGCDDALIGIGIKSTIGLDFTREARSAKAALNSAIRDVEKAIPGAQLIEVQPDLVNLADMAALLGKTRQAMQKYSAGKVVSQKTSFPMPVIFAPAPAWRLVEVTQWLARNTEIEPPATLVETASEAALRNVQIQKRRVDAALAEFEAA